MTDSKIERKQSRVFSNLLPAGLSVENPISLYNPQKTQGSGRPAFFYVGKQLCCATIFSVL